MIKTVFMCKENLQRQLITHYLYFIFFLLSNKTFGVPRLNSLNFDSESDQFQSLALGQLCINSVPYQFNL